eukprot:scaffold18081_cov21-Phaeocystis_antarctica.AAC.1
MQRGGELAGLEGVVLLWRTERTYVITSSGGFGASRQCFYKLSSVRSVRVVALSSIAHQNSLRPAVFLAEHVQPELGLLPLQSVGSSQAVSHTHGGASAFPAE